MSNVIYKPFKSIEEIKVKGEFIKKGKIIPSRILRCSKRKCQHKVTAGTDLYAFPTLSGWLILGDLERLGTYVIRIVGIKNANLNGSPYVNGDSQWLVTDGRTPAETLASFNKHYLQKNKAQ